MQSPDILDFTCKKPEGGQVAKILHFELSIFLLCDPIWLLDHRESLYLFSSEKYDTEKAKSKLIPQIFRFGTKTTSGDGFTLIQPIMIQVFNLKGQASMLCI
jgi:hypothetical protein